MYLPTHTETLGCMYDGAYETVCTHKDAGSPQWIAFTRRTTTDVPTFIHGLYSPSCAPIHAHGEEYAHQDRNDSIRCVCIVYIYVHSRIKAFNIGKGIDTGSDRKRSDSAIFFVTWEWEEWELLSFRSNRY